MSVVVVARAAGVGRLAGLDDVEAAVADIEFDTCGKHGWLNEGPHDSDARNLIMVDAGQDADIRIGAEVKQIERRAVGAECQIGWLTEGNEADPAKQEAAADGVYGKNQHFVDEGQRQEKTPDGQQAIEMRSYGTGAITVTASATGLRSAECIR